MILFHALSILIIPLLKLSEISTMEFLTLEETILATTCRHLRSYVRFKDDGLDVLQTGFDFNLYQLCYFQQDISMNFGFVILTYSNKKFSN